MRFGNLLICLALIASTAAMAQQAPTAPEALKEQAKPWLAKDSFGVIFKRANYNKPVIYTAKPKEGVFEFGASDAYCFRGGKFKADYSVDDGGHLVIDVRLTRPNCNALQFVFDPSTQTGTMADVDAAGQKAVRQDVVMRIE